MRFAIGQRVVVKPVNGYDKPCVSETFGAMAGHYGKVTTDWGDGLYEVQIIGHIAGQVAYGVAMSFTNDDDGVWPFFAVELEPAD